MFEAIYQDDDSSKPDKDESAGLIKSAAESLGFKSVEVQYSEVYVDCHIGITYEYYTAKFDKFKCYVYIKIKE